MIANPQATITAHAVCGSGACTCLARERRMVLANTNNVATIKSTQRNTSQVLGLAVGVFGAKVFVGDCATTVAKFSAAQTTPRPMRRIEAPLKCKGPVMIAS